MKERARQTHMLHLEDYLNIFTRNSVFGLCGNVFCTVTGCQLILGYISHVEKISAHHLS